MRYLLSGTVILLFLATSLLASEQPMSITQQLDVSLMNMADDDWDEGGGTTPDKKEKDKPKEKPSQTHAAGKKSSAKAMALSILIPGAGEYYLGNKREAYYFFAGEVVSWLGFASFRIYGNWKEDDMVRFAAERAGAQIADKDEEFRNYLSFYDNTEQYNTFGRVSDPERPYYHPEDLSHQWNWQAEEDRLAYRRLKNRSREAFRRSEFMIGAMVVNRLASAIFTFRNVRRGDRAVEEFSVTDLSRYHLSIQPYRSIRQIELALDLPL